MMWEWGQKREGGGRKKDKKGHLEIAFRLSKFKQKRKENEKTKFCVLFAITQLIERISEEQLKKKWQKDQKSNGKWPKNERKFQFAITNVQRCRIECRAGHSFIFHWPPPSLSFVGLIDLCTLYLSAEHYFCWGCLRTKCRFIYALFVVERNIPPPLKLAHLSPPPSFWDALFIYGMPSGDETMNGGKICEFYCRIMRRDYALCCLSDGLWCFVRFTVTKNEIWILQKLKKVSQWRKSENEIFLNFALTVKN